MSEPTDADRYPALTEAGRAMLERLAEHPAAPIYRNRSGNRLLAGDLPGLAAFEAETLVAAIDWRPGVPPDWITAFLADTYRRTPHFRARGPAPRALADVPTTSRADLAGDIAAFVPDDVAVDRLINFRTTGTTGHPLLVEASGTDVPAALRGIEGVQHVVPAGSQGEKDGAWRVVADRDVRAVAAQRFEIRYEAMPLSVGKMPTSEAASRLFVPGSMPSACASMMWMPSPSPASKRSPCTNEYVCVSVSTRQSSLVRNVDPSWNVKSPNWIVRGSGCWLKRLSLK